MEYVRFEILFGKWGLGVARGYALDGWHCHAMGDTYLAHEHILFTTGGY